MSVSNNSAKVRKFLDITKFLDEFFQKKLGYSLTHLLTFDICIFKFAEIVLYNLYILQYI